ncbi:MAG: hypothetical protein IPM60_11620 [Rhodospirillales bacterium]|nr:hypothetical protein [Rhodospirillales bacterium]
MGITPLPHKPARIAAGGTARAFGVFSPVKLRRGADSVILSTAARVVVGLMLVSPVTRTGVSGSLIGQAAKDVLRQLGCSVLTVKPDEFVSPVAT